MNNRDVEEILRNLTSLQVLNDELINTEDREQILNFESIGNPNYGDIKNLNVREARQYTNEEISIESEKAKMPLKSREKILFTNNQNSVKSIKQSPPNEKYSEDKKQILNLKIGTIESEESFKLDENLDLLNIEFPSANEINFDHRNIEKYKNLFNLINQLYQKDNVTFQMPNSEFDSALNLIKTKLNKKLKFSKSIISQSIQNCISFCSLNGFLALKVRNLIYNKLSNQVTTIQNQSKLYEDTSKGVIKLFNEILINYQHIILQICSLSLRSEEEKEQNLNCDINLKNQSLNKLNSRIEELTTKLLVSERENKVLIEKIQKMTATEIYKEKKLIEHKSTSQSHQDFLLLKSLPKKQDESKLSPTKEDKELYINDLQVSIPKNQMNSSRFEFELKSGRVLTFNQLKDLILDIFEQKSKFDIRCYEMKQPRQNIEQFTYIYFNQKYGLKSLIIEWTAALINGIKKYSIVDADILLFGDILKNECDEDFRIIINQIKLKIVKTIHEKLKTDKQFIHKSESEIEDHINNLMNGYIDRKIWIYLIKNLFNNEHQRTLEQVILKQIELNNSENHPKELFAESQSNLKDIKRQSLKDLESSKNLFRFREKSKTKILFTEFQNIILNYQIMNHENYLKGFISKFKEIDKNDDGIINDEEFKILITKIIPNTNEEHMNKMLRIVDPFCHSQIPLSECLALFSSEIITCSQINEA